MRALVLLNRAAGTLVGASPEEVAVRIRDGFRAGGAEAEVRIVDGADMDAAAKAAARGPYDAVVAGGGDGTLNTVASALVGTDKAFGVLPLGTHNHFAKHLGIPLDLDDAVATLASCEPRAIDVAEVNGHLFLNFSGIGLHPEVVRAREAQVEPRRRNKFVALILAFFQALRHLPLLRVGIGTGREVRWRVTPSVIVCTNPLQMRIFGVDGASYPDRGLLNLYVARPTRWYAIAWLALKAVLHRLDPARGFEVLALPEVRLSLHRRRVPVSIDGEVTVLDTPLVYRMRRGALQVLTPPLPAATPDMHT